MGLLNYKLQIEPRTETFIAPETFF